MIPTKSDYQEVFADYGISEYTDELFKIITEANGKTVKYRLLPHPVKLIVDQFQINFNAAASVVNRPPISKNKAATYVLDGFTNSAKLTALANNNL